jgi:hypothetical protein
VDPKSILIDGIIKWAKKKDTIIGSEKTGKKRPIEMKGITILVNSWVVGNS